MQLLDTTSEPNVGDGSGKEGLARVGASAAVKTTGLETASFPGSPLPWSLFCPGPVRSPPSGGLLGPQCRRV